MEYPCIYEVGDSSISFPLVFILICIAELGLIIYTVLKWKQIDISGKGLICFLLAFLLMVILVTIREYYITKATLQSYERGEYLIAEGVIEDYDTSFADSRNGPDHFSVNSVDFDITGSGIGYLYRQRDGGVLRNGLHCKIYYVPDRCFNVIMKLLIETPSD